MLAELVVAAGEMAAVAVIDETADEQIEPAVVVEIEPDGAGGPVILENFGAQPGVLAHVGEGAVAVVAVEDGAAVGGDEQIGEAVVIVIAHGHAHAEGASGDAGFFCDVGEGAVAIVFVKRVADGARGLEEIARTAVHQVDVHPAVVVVIEESAAGAHGFRQVMVLGGGVVVHPADAAGFGRDLLEQRPGAAAGVAGESERCCRAAQKLPPGDAERSWHGLSWGRDRRRGQFGSGDR